MSEHTPGPWKANTFMVVGGDNYSDRITHVGGNLPPSRVQESVANARLIAAAPELYEACALLEAYLYAVAPKSNEMQLVSAAIAKATGAPCG